MVARAWFLVAVGVAVIVTGIVTIATHHSPSTSGHGHPATLGHAGSRPSATTSAPPTRTPTRTPTPSPSPTVSASPPAHRHRPAGSGAEPPKAKKEAKKGPITYVVKPGDNLWDIAQWFHLHGYGALYEWNRQVIGDNPALIFPGQRIVVSEAGNTVRPPAPGAGK